MKRAVENKLQRVASAIASAQQSANWRQFLPAAHAALLAMREPSEAMLQSVVTDDRCWDVLIEDWQCMIDTALIGGTELTQTADQHVRIAKFLP